ncbi:DUF1707 domain-containing protein, partial [Kribbella sp. NPDC003557]|uniref:DUF1707 SHOCT-like domain-containing protein n=1 Tax=Kribbella sp. NPDC003557 TaxID=3154449 RepID=UPI0033BA3DE1
GRDRGDSRGSHGGHGGRDRGDSRGSLGGHGGRDRGDSRDGHGDALDAGNRSGRENSAEASSRSGRESPVEARDPDGRDGLLEERGRGRVRGEVKRVRIGDAERDRAVSALSEHFVAGRLTQGEFEERSEVVTRARYADDLEPLFDDLPVSTELQVAQGPANLRRRPGPPPPFLMLAPFLMIGLVVSSIALAAPWLLWGMFWLMLISGMSRRRHHYR